jgi:hypothetical protein
MKGSGFLVLIAVVTVFGKYVDGKVTRLPDIVLGLTSVH